MSGIFAHLLLFESGPEAAGAIESVLAQRGCDVRLKVTDNASSGNLYEQLQARFPTQVTWQRNPENLGFCAAHNEAAREFLDGDSSYFCIVNPDLRLVPDCLRVLAAAIEPAAGPAMATPKLYRADQEMQPLEPSALDAAGMEMTRSLRHFDRGSGKIEEGAFGKAEDVFGGTGALLMFNRAAVEALLLTADYESDVDRLYPQLAHRREHRAMLFDEAFFAYREDADLAWRAQLLGVPCRYVPSAVAFHRRVVTPERRAELPAFINRLGVRNRFLLQLNNYRFADAPQTIIPGFIIRNLIVLAGVLLRERSSLGAFLDLLSLRRRSLARRKELQRRRRVDSERMRRWFV